MADLSQGGGTPFESIDVSAQRAINAMLDVLATLDQITDGTCTLILVKVTLMALQETVRNVIACDAPNNTIVPSKQTLNPDRSADGRWAASDIPDFIPDSWTDE